MVIHVLRYLALSLSRGFSNVVFFAFLVLKPLHVSMVYDDILSLTKDIPGCTNSFGIVDKEAVYIISFVSQKLIPIDLC